MSNRIPDYEEPFLRQHVDRPEFLFGIDTNNNTWIDRFENDTEPDFPYSRDRRGFNVYAGLYLTPAVRVTAGHLREEVISSDKRNYTTYALLSANVDHPSRGHLRFFGVLKSIEDDIPDDLMQWHPGSSLRHDRNVEVKDPLLGRDTGFASVYLGHRFSLLGRRLNVRNSFKYDLWHQRMEAAQRHRFGLQKNEFFCGIINAAEYIYDMGRVRITPRWKSEFRWQTYDLFSSRERKELTEIFGTIVEMPFLHKTKLSTGVEYVIFRDFHSKINNFQSFITATHLTNVTDYMGYELTTQVGMKFDLQNFQDPSIKTRTLTEGFITVYAGLGK